MLVFDFLSSSRDGLFFVTLFISLLPYCVIPIGIQVFEECQEVEGEKEGRGKERRKRK